MGFTGDDLTGSLMIRLVLCRCTNCYQKCSKAPAPQDVPEKLSTVSRSPDWPPHLSAHTHFCPEPRSPFWTTNSRAAEHALGGNLGWQCMEHIKCWQQAGHDRESNYTSVGEGRESKQRWKPRTPSQQWQTQPTITSSSTLPHFACLLSSICAAPSKSAPHQCVRL